MGSNYPATLDDTSKFPQDLTDDTDSKTGSPRTGLVGFHAQILRDLGDAAIEIETELGTLPKGPFASVRERLDARDFKRSCRAATAAALPACTYANGPPATLTGDANGALAAQDGVTLVQGDRLFVKDQAAPLQNGIYELTQVGTGALPFILTRAYDADSAVKLSDALYVAVEQGTLNRDSLWELVTDNPITLGTTALRFTKNHPAYPEATMPPSSLWLPTGAKIESMPRHDRALANTAILTSGQLKVGPLGILRAGDTLSSLTFFSQTTAGATLTNQWACLVRVSDRQIMAVSPSAGAAAWGANTAKTFTFNTPYTADKDELMWYGIMVAATTVPSLSGNAGGSAILAGGPVMAGTANTGLSTPLAVGTIITAPSAGLPIAYCYAS